ncbi:MAG: RagB/SusD family nutrient uptake outer membrane protein [Muribaculum sp.]|nr:RagB/SusD family nutrient uptake outer membrane protein [Muribaculum sp.]
MKTIKYLCVIVVLGVLASACSDMDLDPKGILSENTLLKSDEGVKRYLALIYQDAPIEDFNYGQNGDQIGYAVNSNKGWHTSDTWQAQKSSPASCAQEATGRAHDYGNGWGYWPYDRIHDINNFLEQLPNYASNFSPQQVVEYEAEARFLRAFFYFGMVKRYGGVPIVARTLDPTAPSSEIALPRNTEYECWKFIYDDLKFAMENGSKEKSNGRANRYAAAALMSRAMIYAGSTAKYGGYIVTSGEATSKGLMGMPQGTAKEFYQYAYDACVALKDAGFSLHNGGDKESAFVEVFTQNCPEEDIFVKQYTDVSEAIWETALFHSWDTMVLPLGTNLAGSIGCALQPTWELMSLYEHPQLIDDRGRPVRFDNIEDYWNNPETEARARATFFFSGMTEPLSGTVLDIQAGVYTSYPGTAADGTAETQGSENDYTNQWRTLADKPLTYKDILGYKNVKISGAHGMANRTNQDEGYSYTGAFIRKYVSTTDKAGRQGLRYSKTAFKVFRYGEILCNWAEAAYELGLETGNNTLKEEAIQHVNELRERAGAHAYTYNPSPADVGSEIYGFEVDENLQFIRDERARELAFENHRLFDIRRWRVADKMFLDGKYSHTLSAYYVLDEGKWIFLNEVDGHARKVTFNRKSYYEQIPGDAIGKNPNLIRNDGY